MLLRNLVQRLRPIRKLRAFSTAEPQIIEPVSKIPNHLNIAEYRQHQLERLQAMKPSEFTPAALNQLIADFLVSPRKPDIQVAGKLLDKFLFKVPGVDESGDLCSLYLLQLIDAEDLETAVEFFQKLLNSKEEVKLVNSFMFESIWKAVFDKKADALGFELLKSCKESANPAISELVTAEFKEQLILQLFLPRLNWPAVDFLISESVSNNNQITIPAAVLQEIFHVLLNPIPNDLYYDPTESEPFTGNLINPRFHRLIEILDRWKSAGIPIKGSQIAKALEETFKKFLPTDAMMESLQKLL